jgi:hypothetical protein
LQRSSVATDLELLVTIIEFIAGDDMSMTTQGSVLHLADAISTKSFATGVVGEEDPKMRDKGAKDVYDDDGIMRECARHAKSMFDNPATRRSAGEKSRSVTAMTSRVTARNPRPKDALGKCARTCTNENDKPWRRRNQKETKTRIRIRIWQRR